jgi:hypothetical protein
MQIFSSRAAYWPALSYSVRHVIINCRKLKKDGAKVDTNATAFIPNLLEIGQVVQNLKWEKNYLIQQHSFLLKRYKGKAVPVPTVTGSNSIHS